MQYQEVRKLVVTPPFWCPGNPLDWKCVQGGIAHFAADGKVGLFNLSWWFLHLPKPPATIQEYRHPGIVWTILQASSARVGGMTVEHLAAFHDQPTFIRRIQRSPSAFGDVWPLVQQRLKKD